MALETLKITELGLECYSLDECPRNWERPGYFDEQTCKLEPLPNPFGPKVLPMSPV